MHAAQEVSVLVKLEEIRLRLEQLSLEFARREHEYDQDWVHQLMLLDRSVRSLWDLVPDPPSPPPSDQQFDFDSSGTEDNTTTPQAT